MQTSCTGRRVGHAEAIKRIRFKGPQSSKRKEWLCQVCFVLNTYICIILSSSPFYSLEFDEKVSMKQREQQNVNISLSLSLSGGLFLYFVCSGCPPCHQMQEWPEYLHLRTCLAYHQTHLQQWHRNCQRQKNGSVPLPTVDVGTNCAQWQMQRTCFNICSILLQIQGVFLTQCSE